MFIIIHFNEYVVLWMKGQCLHVCQTEVYHKTWRIIIILMSEKIAKQYMKGGLHFITLALKSDTFQNHFHSV